MDRRVTPPKRVTSPTWGPHLLVNRLVVLIHPFLCYVAGGLLLAGIR